MQKITLKIFYTFLYAVLLFSCNNNNETLIELPTIKIDANYISDLPLALSTIADSISYIKLQSDSSCLLGEISSMSTTENKFYIFDYQVTNALYAFNNKGDFINKYGKKSSEAGIYSRYENYDISNFGVSLYDDNKKEIIIYGNDGSIKKTIKLNNYTHSFANLDDSGFLFFNDYKNVANYATEKFYNIALTDTNNVVKRQLSPYYLAEAKLKRITIERNIYRFNDSLYLLIATNDTLFVKDKAQIRPYYYIDFGKYKLPKDFWEKNDKDRIEIQFAKYSSNAKKLLITENMIGFEFLSHGLSFNEFFFPRNSKSFTSSLIFNDLDGVPVTDIQTSDQDNIYAIGIPKILISYLEAYRKNTLLPPYDKFKLSEKTIKFIESLKENDNPVIIKIHIRKNM